MSVIIVTTLMEISEYSNIHDFASYCENLRTISSQIPYKFIVYICDPNLIQKFSNIQNVEFRITNFESLPGYNWSRIININCGRANGRALKPFVAQKLSAIWLSKMLLCNNIAKEYELNDNDIIIWHDLKPRTFIPTLNFGLMESSTIYTGVYGDDGKKRMFKAKCPYPTTLCAKYIIMKVGLLIQYNSIFSNVIQIFRNNNISHFSDETILSYMKQNNLMKFDNFHVLTQR